MTLEETIKKLGAMKLHAMASSLKERLSRGDHCDLSVDEMIGLIVDDEWMSRERRKLTRRLQVAKFKIPATMENIDYQLRRGLVKSKMLNLAALQWVGHHQDVLIIGPTGVGKSFLAQALGHHACMRGHSVHYIRASNLLHQYQLSHADGSFGQILARLVKFDILIIDDWGIGTLKGQERRDMLDLIEDRSEIKSTIITSQLPVDHWHEFIGDETIADAICDRLAHRAYRLDLEGESIRKTLAGKMQET